MAQQMITDRGCKQNKGEFAALRQGYGNTQRVGIRRAGNPRQRPEENSFHQHHGQYGQ